jgi:hypothetical protein
VATVNAGLFRSYRNPQMREKCGRLGLLNILKQHAQPGAGPSGDMSQHVSKHTSSIGDNSRPAAIHKWLTPLGDRVHIAAAQDNLLRWLDREPTRDGGGFRGDVINHLEILRPQILRGDVFFNGDTPSHSTAQH